MHNKQRKEGQMIRVPQMAKKYCGKKYRGISTLDTSNMQTVYGSMEY